METASAKKEDSAANVGPISAHVLGKYFAWRGRKSTGFCYSILSPNDLPWTGKKGEVAPGAETSEIRGVKEETGVVTKDERAQKSVKSDFLDFMKTYPDLELGKTGCSEQDLEEAVSKSELSSLSEDDFKITNAKPRHFKVHGKDAYENAMKSLGNVNTLFNRYGYDESKKQ